jgi:hypothetical protein
LLEKNIAVTIFQTANQSVTILFLDHPKFNFHIFILTKIYFFIDWAKIDMLLRPKEGCIWKNLVIERWIESSRLVDVLKL